MKNLIQSFLFALTVAVVAYCALFIFNGNKKGYTVTKKTTQKEQPKSDYVTKKADDKLPQEKEVPENTPPANTSQETPMVDKTPPTADIEEDETEVLDPVTVSAETYSDDGTFYRIQIGVISPQNTNYEPFRILQGLGNLYSDPMPDGRKRIILGDFYDKKQAQMVLAEAKKQGFKDSFIKEIRPDYLEETADSPEETADNNSNSTNQNVAYQVRLGVFSQPPPVKKLSTLNDLGKVNMQLSDDGYTIVALGTFTNRAEALEMLTKVRERGFADAFIATTDKAMNISQNITPTETTAKPVTSKPAQTAAGNVTEYMVQVGAAHKPALYTFKNLSGIGAVYTEKNMDSGLTKVMIGPYYSRQNAEKALAEAKTKGFASAFISTQRQTVTQEGGISRGSRVKVFEKNNL